MANEAIMVFLMSCHTVKAKINAWNLSMNMREYFYNSEHSEPKGTNKCIMLL